MKRLGVVFLSFVCMAITMMSKDITAQAAVEGVFAYEVSGGQAKIVECNPYVVGELEIPDTLGGYPVTSIKEYAFGGCAYLSGIKIPNSVTSIEKYAFVNCSGLTSILIPTSVKVINAYTFANCSSLKTVGIPKSVTMVYASAFHGCNNFNEFLYQGTEKESKKITFLVEAGVKMPNITWQYNAYNRVLIEQFVSQLYYTCLNREPDAGGKASWVNNLKNGYVTGIQAAKGFIFSPEFKNKNYCNEDYVKQLYRAFMGREADAGGLAGWVKKLNNGATREEVFNGFALSKEFINICADYEIKVGSAIAVPKYGTIPTGNCSACGVEDGVTQFVKRLYRICLDREADAGGLASWSKQLWNHTSSGRKVAQGFIFSQEFKNKNYSNEVFVEYLYQAFMGRASDAGGKANWVKLLNQGWTRKQVFDGFAGSKEFTNICNQYGILRD